MKQVSVADMMHAGLHFGHKTAKWHPAMREYIFGERNGVHLVNLEKTQAMLDRAQEFARTVAARGGMILFVGTKRQAKKALEQAANACGMPYVNGRWLGGTFTNFSVIIAQSRRMQDLEAKKASGQLEKYTKKEQLKFAREIENLQKNFGGLRTLNKLPDAIFVVDINMEGISIAESKKSKIPVIAITDTNTDPRRVDYAIPGNDDAIKGIELVAGAIADAINEGKSQIKVAPQEVQQQALAQVKLGRDAAPAAAKK